MSEVKFNNEEILVLNRSLQAAGQFNVPVSVALKIATTTREVDNHINDFREVEKVLYTKHGKKVDGELVYLEDENGNKTEQPAIKSMDGYIKERSELLDETKTLNVPLFTQKDFESITKLFGADDDGEGGEEKELPPVVMKVWVMLKGEDVEIEEFFN